MSMFGLNFGGLAPFTPEPPQQKLQRLASPPPLPSFLLQPQAPRPTPPQAQPPRQTPPPTPTAQPHKPRNGTHHHGPSERAGGKQAAGRGSANASDQTPDGTSNAVLVDVFQPIEEREQESGQGDSKREQEEEGGGGSSSKEQRAAAGELDCDTLVDEMTQQVGEEGIFEVMMPDGKTLGVVVRLDDKRAQFLLSPSDDKLAELLKQEKMELEVRLARRMNKDVDISLL